MCRLQNIAMRDYQESVTIGQTDTRTHRQTPDKVIPMCRYASQATQKSNGIGKPIEAQVQRKPGHPVSDMIRKKNQSHLMRMTMYLFYTFIHYVLLTIYMYMYMLKIYKTLNYEIKSVQVIMHNNQSVYID